MTICTICSAVKVLGVPERGASASTAEGLRERAIALAAGGPQDNPYAQGERLGAGGLAL